MSIRNILLPLLPGDDLDTRMRSVVPIVRRLRAQVDVLLLTPDPIETLSLCVSGFMPAGRTLAELEDACASGAGQAREAFGRACETYELVPDGRSSDRSGAASFDALVGRPDVGLVGRGRLADLIAIGRPSHLRGWEAMLVGAAIFETGRPVLLTPPDGNASVAVFGRVAVAWNGSLQAARAVAAAMPILRMADHVVVIGAGPDEEPFGGGGTASQARDLADALARHGISVTSVVLTPDRHQDTGAALLQKAHGAEATLLVMGAYTHGRVHQAVLGGVTRHMFHHADLPLLVAH